jgi:hypothetical protein
MRSRYLIVLAACILVLSGLACCPPTMPNLPIELGSGGEAESEGPSDPSTSGQAAEVRILSGSYYYSVTDSLWFVGELKNRGDTDLSSVKVTIALKKANGDLLDVATGYADLEVVYPGEVAPFVVLFSEGPRGWEDYEVSVETEPAQSWNYSFSYRQLEPFDHSGQEIDLGGYRIIGQVRNTGSQEAEYVKVVATLYNARGEVVGVRNTYAEADHIDPGESSTFEIETYSLAGPVERYSLVAEGAALETKWGTDDA